MDCLHHALVGIAGPMTLQQFDLYMVERIQIGKAVLDRARQQRILIEQCLLAGDGEQHFNRESAFIIAAFRHGLSARQVEAELVCSARPRRYVFHYDEVAEAEAQGLPLASALQIRAYGPRRIGRGEAREHVSSPGLSSL
jgi:hypothetical protein